MKTLLTKKFLSIFFSILSLNAFAVEVIVPSYLQGVVQDSYALKGHNYIYEVEGNLNKQPITPERTDNKTIEDLLKSLMFSYLSKNNPLFLSLHSEKAQQALKQLDQKMVEKNWEFFSKVKKPFIDFYFKHREGFIVGWKHEGESVPQLLYTVKNGKSWLIDTFSADVSDKRFTNLSFYLTYRPLKLQRPKIKKSFTKGDKDLNLELSVETGWIHLLKKEDAKWKLKTSMKDNSKGKYRLDDHDSRVGEITIKFLPEHFEAGKDHEILILEGTYPITHYPLELAHEGQIKY